ncbi:MAG: sensor domain-containing diguanylate cyclase [Thermodesulfobacteriota bacterium]
MTEFPHYRKQIKETIDQLRESINKLQTLENEYLKQEEQLYIISEFANDWEYWQAPDGRYRYVSPSCESVTGYKPSDFYNDPGLLKKIIAANNWEKWKLHSHKMAQNGQVNPIEFQIKTREGDIRWIHHICQSVTGKDGEDLGVRGSNRDITNLKELQERLKHMAGHDLLTDLPNRALFLEHLAQTIKEAKRNSTMFAVVFIDLDGFKEINDTHGHEAGDHVLKMLANMLTGVIRENDIVARLGGDEFVGMFDLKEENDVDIIRQKISETLSNEISCTTYGLTIYYSLGMSIYPVDGATVDSLLRKADQEMYRQKKKNKAERQQK